jgi:hypothetical protein
MPSIHEHIVSCVLRTWNGGEGFPPSYFQTPKGKAVVKAFIDALERNNLKLADKETANDR